MTDEHTDAAHEELAKWLSCTKERLQQSNEVDLAAITTAEEAMIAVGRAKPGSSRHAVLFLKWIELAKTMEELRQVPIVRGQYQPFALIVYHYYIRMVTLCQTQAHVRETARYVRPGGLAWSLLVRKGLEILQKEEGS